MSRADALPSLTDAIEALPAAARAVRQARRLSLRDAAEQIGIPFNNLNRFENGGNCTLETVLAVARWVETN